MRERANVVRTSLCNHSALYFAYTENGWQMGARGDTLRVLRKQTVDRNQFTDKVCTQFSNVSSRPTQRNEHPKLLFQHYVVIITWSE